jgi:hypothetical protein
LLAPKIRRRHSRHSLVNQKKRDRIVSDFQFADNIKRGLPGIGAQDAVIGGVFSPQIAFDSPENFRIVINRDNRRLCHNSSLENFYLVFYFTAN